MRGIANMTTLTAVRPGQCASGRLAAADEGGMMMAVRTQATAAPSHKKIFQHLYVQVLCAITIGVLLGHFYPSLGAQMKPLGDMFIQAIKMVIAPIIFCTVVHGIASMKDMKKVGRVGLKAIV
jgi:aerobic C4-dicarboxylate transport protein